MNRWMAAAPVVLLAATGCLATHGDIETLQAELRASRSQAAAGDTSLLRADEARRAQIAALSAKIDRLNDSLRILTARFASFQATASGEFDTMGQQMVRVQALLGQNTKNVQETRAKLEALSEQANQPPPTPTPTGTASSPVDTSQHATPGLPGPSTLFITAKDQLDNRAYATARSGFERLLSAYPTADEAPRALLYIGESYKGEGNTTASDSVYQLVASRYPQAAEAATGLYRHGKLLWDTNKSPQRSEARIVFDRLIRDYPNSDEANLAKDLMNPRE